MVPSPLTPLAGVGPGLWQIFPTVAAALTVLDFSVSCGITVQRFSYEKLGSTSGSAQLADSHGEATKQA